VEVKKMQQENEQNNNNFVSKIIIIIEGKEVHLSSESTSLKDFGIHISQLNLKKENAELRRENAELRRENAELRKQVITLQTICDKYFNLYGPLPTI
jgi:cell division protein FtsB